MRTITEIREAYLKELIRYRKWADGKTKLYGKDSEPMIDWGGYDYHKVVEWNAALRLTERILGLTKAEIKALNEQAGIQN